MAEMIYTLPMEYTCLLSLSSCRKDKQLFRTNLIFNLRNTKRHERMEVVLFTTEKASKNHKYQMII
ncbi:hypothetical protein HZS_4664 [Henneguya salminicola]|nr:hypothetical protein HZS_4664 [Henneguya salminicola]